MKTTKYVVTITYNFDSAYVCVPCKTIEEAKEVYMKLLNEEVKTITNESGYTPSIVYDSDEDITFGVTLIYEEDATLYDAKGNQTNFDMAFYKIMELSNDTYNVTLKLSTTNGSEEYPEYYDLIVDKKIEVSMINKAIEKFKRESVDYSSDDLLVYLKEIFDLDVNPICFDIEINI